MQTLYNRLRLEQKRHPLDVRALWTQVQRLDHSHDSCAVDWRCVDNNERPLRYHRGDGVVVFQYYQQKYVTLRNS